MSLRELYLGANQLMILPECFGQLQSLEILWLFNNQLTKLPESFGQLQSLQDLSLSNNQLATLPKSLPQLSNLVLFDIRNNPLDTRSQYLLVQLQSNAKRVEIKQTSSSSTPIPILQKPPPSETDTEKPLTGEMSGLYSGRKKGQIHRQFTYFCESCKIWYAMDDFSKIRCPRCRNPIKLSYLCRNCKRRFIVQRPTTYYCPLCKTAKLVP